jgi:methylthioribose-1-phosphate isomerase
MNFYTIKWEDDAVKMIDQRKLPTEEIYNRYQTAEEVARAIKEMVIRGAPAIGVAGAYGMALAAQQNQNGDPTKFKTAMDRSADMLISQRPTAVNLPWAVKRIQKVYQQAPDQNQKRLQKIILQEAHRIFEEDVAMCRPISLIATRGPLLPQDRARHFRSFTRPTNRGKNSASSPRRPAPSFKEPDLPVGNFLKIISM